MLGHFGVTAPTFQAVAPAPAPTIALVSEPRRRAAPVATALPTIRTTTTTTATKSFVPAAVPTSVQPTFRATTTTGTVAAAPTTILDAIASVFGASKTVARPASQVSTLSPFLPSGSSAAYAPYETSSDITSAEVPLEAAAEEKVDASTETPFYKKPAVWAVALAAVAGGAFLLHRRRGKKPATGAT